MDKRLTSYIWRVSEVFYPVVPISNGNGLLQRKLIKSKEVNPINAEEEGTTANQNPHKRDPDPLPSEPTRPTTLAELLAHWTPLDENLPPILDLPAEPVEL